MGDLTRRNFLARSAMTAAAGGLLVAAPSLVLAQETLIAPSPGMGRFANPLSPREKLRRRNFPNVPLRTHLGKEVRFYDDLIKGKIVTLNFMYAKCEGICPGISANLARVQKLLRGRIGKDIFMYSFTLQPEVDTPRALKMYAEMFHAGPGWTFLTGKPADLELLRRSLGYTNPDPIKDKDKDQHIGNIRYGNEPLMLWAACPGMAHAKWIAESISWMTRPQQRAAA
jgi:protein SCO1/2